MIQWMRRHFWLTLITIVAVVLIGVLSGWLPFDRAARAVVQPVGRVFTTWGRSIGGWFEEIGKLGSYKSENQRLSAEVTDLKRQLAEIEETKLENQELRSQLNFKPPTGWREVGAEVVNYHTDNSRQLLRINQGKNAGVNSGQAVLAGGQLVGVITEAANNSAEVMLTTDAAFRALAISQKHRTTGLVSGTPPAGLSLDRILREQSLEIGETIVTSGVDGAFPSGLRLGEVISVAQAPGSIFQKAQLSPPFSLSRLRVVSILVRGT